jgi:hypothetical protein
VADVPAILGFVQSKGFDAETASGMSHATRQSVAGVAEPPIEPG